MIDRNDGQTVTSNEVTFTEGKLILKVDYLTFGSHCSANFQPILDCYIPKFKLEYDNLENIKTDCVNIVVFNFHQIKRLKFFFGSPGLIVQLNQTTMRALMRGMNTVEEQSNLPDAEFEVDDAATSSSTASEQGYEQKSSKKGNMKPHSLSSSKRIRSHSQALQQTVKSFNQFW